MLLDERQLSGNPRDILRAWKRKHVCTIAVFVVNFSVAGCSGPDEEMHGDLIDNGELGVEVLGEKFRGRGLRE